MGSVGTVTNPEVAALLARVASLEAERDRLRDRLATSRWETRRAMEERDEAEARVASLTEALTKIAANEYGPDGDGPDFVTIARAALAVGEGEPEYRCDCGAPSKNKMGHEWESEPPATCPNRRCRDGKMERLEGVPRYGLVDCTWPGHTDPTPPTCPSRCSEGFIDQEVCPDPWHTDPTTPERCPSCHCYPPVHPMSCGDPWHTDPTGTPE